MGEVKGQGHIVHPVSNRCISFSFHIDWTNHSWDMSNRVFDLEKHIRNFQRKFDKIRVFTEFCQNLIRWSAWPEGYSCQVCGDWLSGSYFILQTSKFLFINVTVVTLGQGHQKVIQYIFTDLYFLFPKYLRFSSNGFNVRRESLRRLRWRTRTRTRRRTRTETIKSTQTGVTHSIMVMVKYLIWANQMACVGSCDRY